LINAALLLVVTGGIAWEAILRFRHPEAVQGNTVIVVAAIGVAVNLGTALMFMSGRKGDLNVRAAFAHMAGDAAIALGVVVAGFVILHTGWVWLDPIVSLAIAVLVIAGTWGLARDSVSLALHAVPAGVDVAKIRNFLSSIDGVSEIQDLHIWGLSTTETALTAHLIFSWGYPGDAVRQEIAAELKEHFSIQHTTIQIEIGDSGQACALAPDEVV
jgi:cobalt-zinc-cadmium efflux system protein